MSEANPTKAVKFQVVVENTTYHPRILVRPDPLVTLVEELIHQLSAHEGDSESVVAFRARLKAITNSIAR